MPSRALPRTDGRALRCLTYRPDIQKRSDAEPLAIGHRGTVLSETRNLIGSWEGLPAGSQNIQSISTLPSVTVGAWHNAGMLPTALDGLPFVRWLMPWRRAARGWSVALPPRRRGGAGRLRRKHRRDQTASNSADRPGLRPGPQRRAAALRRSHVRRAVEVPLLGAERLLGLQDSHGSHQHGRAMRAPAQNRAAGVSASSPAPLSPCVLLKKIDETQPATGNAPRFFRYRGIRKPHAGFSETGTECAHQGKPMARSVPCLILYFIY